MVCLWLLFPCYWCWFVFVAVLVLVQSLNSDNLITIKQDHRSGKILFDDVPKEVIVGDIYFKEIEPLTLVPRLVLQDMFNAKDISVITPVNVDNDAESAVEAQYKALLKNPGHFCFIARDAKELTLPCIHVLPQLLFNHHLRTIIIEEEIWSAADDTAVVAELRRQLVPKQSDLLTAADEVHSANSDEDDPGYDSDDDDDDEASSADSILKETHLGASRGHFDVVNPSRFASLDHIARTTTTRTHSRKHHKHHARKSVKPADLHELDDVLNFEDTHERMKADDDEDYDHNDDNRSGTGTGTGIGIGSSAESESVPEADDDMRADTDADVDSADDSDGGSHDHVEVMEDGGDIAGDLIINRRLLSMAPESQLEDHGGVEVQNNEDQDKEELSELAHELKDDGEPQAEHREAAGTGDGVPHPDPDPPTAEEDGATAEALGKEHKEEAEEEAAGKADDTDGATEAETEMEKEQKEHTGAAAEAAEQGDVVSDPPPPAAETDAALNEEPDKEHEEEAERKAGSEPEREAGIAEENEKEEAVKPMETARKGENELLPEEKPTAENQKQEVADEAAPSLLEAEHGSGGVDRSSSEFGSDSDDDHSGYDAQMLSSTDAPPNESAEHEHEHEHEPAPVHALGAAAEHPHGLAPPYVHAEAEGIHAVIHNDVLQSAGAIADQAMHSVLGLGSEHSSTYFGITVDYELSSKPVPFRVTHNVLFFLQHVIQHLLPVMNNTDALFSVAAADAFADTNPRVSERLAVVILNRYESMQQDLMLPYELQFETNDRCVFGGRCILETQHKPEHSTLLTVLDHVARITFRSVTTNGMHNASNIRFIIEDKSKHPISEIFNHKFSDIAKVGYAALHSVAKRAATSVVATVLGIPYHFHSSSADVNIHLEMSSTNSKHAHVTAAVTGEDLLQQIVDADTKADAHNVDAQSAVIFHLKSRKMSPDPTNHHYECCDIELEDDSIFYPVLHVSQMKGQLPQQNGSGHAKESTMGVGELIAIKSNAIAMELKIAAPLLSPKSNFFIHDVVYYVNSIQEFNDKTIDGFAKIRTLHRLLYPINMIIRVPNYRIFFICAKWSESKLATADAAAQTENAPSAKRKWNTAYVSKCSQNMYYTYPIINEFTEHFTDADHKNNTRKAIEAKTAALSKYDNANFLQWQNTYLMSLISGILSYKKELSDNKEEFLTFKQKLIRETHSLYSSQAKIDKITEILIEEESELSETSERLLTGRNKLKVLQSQLNIDEGQIATIEQMLNQFHEKDMQHPFQNLKQLVQEINLAKLDLTRLEKYIQTNEHYLNLLKQELE